MNLVDFITFVISFGLFIFLMIRRALKDREHRLNPHKAKGERNREEEEYNDFLRSLNIDDDEEEELPKELRSKKMRSQEVKPNVKSNVKSFGPPSPPLKFEVKKTILPPTSYDVHKEHSTSRAKSLVEAMPHLQDIAIYHEIFGPPKAFRNPWE